MNLDKTGVVVSGLTQDSFGLGHTHIHRRTAFKVDTKKRSITTDILIALRTHHWSAFQYSIIMPEIIVSTFKQAAHYSEFLIRSECDKRLLLSRIVILLIAYIYKASTFGKFD